MPNQALPADAKDRAAEAQRWLLSLDLRVSASQRQQTASAVKAAEQMRG